MYNSRALSRFVVRSGGRDLQRLVPSTGSFSRTSRVPQRGYTSTQSLQKEEDHDLGPKKTHLRDKTQAYDVQTAASKEAHKERESKEHAQQAMSQATTEKDVRKSNEKSKLEFPEANEPVIGMNDERGRKGR